MGDATPFYTSPWYPVFLVLAPVATLIVGVIASVVAYVASRHRRQAEIRSEWWRRAQYAIDLCKSGDYSQMRLGMDILSVLGSTVPDDLDSMDEEILPSTRKGHKTLRKSWEWNATAADYHMLRYISDSVIDVILDNPSDGHGRRHGSHR